MLCLATHLAGSPADTPSRWHRHQGPGQAGAVPLIVDGQTVGRTDLKRTVPAAFTATETFDVGVGLGSPVSLAYFDRRPFAFEGTIEKMDIKLK